MGYDFYHLLQGFILVIGFRLSLLRSLLKWNVSSLAVASGLLLVNLPQAKAQTSVPTDIAQTSPARTLCPAQLEPAITAIVNRPQFARSRWGGLIQTLSPAGTPATLYNRDARRYFIPASSTKLLTTAAALQRLKPQYRIRTSVYRVQNTGNQIVLRVVGRGDPSLTSGALKSLAEQLKQRGISRIDRLIGDDSYFNGTIVPPDWEWGDVQAGYGAPVNGLIVNGNEIGLTLIPQAAGQPLRVQWDNPNEASGWRIENYSRTVATTEPEFLDVGRDPSQPILRIRGQLRAGSAAEPVAISVPNPAQNFLQQFRRALVAQQITVGQIQAATTPGNDKDPELAFILSPPLSTLLAETNQQSNNLYAEALLRILGRVSTPTPPSAVEQGLTTLTATLTPLGVDPTGYRLVDGSGLSRQNLISPEALVQTLRAMARIPESPIYRDSLAVAGVSGTLQGRFQGTPAQGIVRAKTGTLSGAVSLAGYVQPPNYQPLVFSLVVNQSDQSASTLRGAIDDIVLLLTQLRNC